MCASNTNYIEECKLTTALITWMQTYYFLAAFYHNLCYQFITLKIIYHQINFRINRAWQISYFQTIIHFSYLLWVSSPQLNRTELLWAVKHKDKCRRKGFTLLYRKGYTWQAQTLGKTHNVSYKDFTFWGLADVLVSQAQNRSWAPVQP